MLRALLAKSREWLQLHKPEANVVLFLSVTATVIFACYFIFAYCSH